jgi:hypothetical protein
MATHFAFTAGAGLGALAALALVVAGCSSSSSSPSTSSTAAQTGAGTCTYPAAAKAGTPASGMGCFAAPSGQSCQVSNGATVLADGGVENGTETCTSQCAASEYELTCNSGSVMGSIPDPDPSLDCKVIAQPTPSDLLFYCCPCAN